MSRERLVIDCQILQTRAFDRGMGKYTLSLISALSKNKSLNKSYKSIFLLLNKNLDQEHSRVQEISKHIPKAKIIWADLPVNVAVDTDQKYENAQRILEQTILKQFANSQVDYLVMSPFFVDAPVVFPKSATRKLTVVYDLIPYRIWKKQRIFPDNIYFKHFTLFIEADHLLTISNSVRDDLMTILGIEGDKITSIDGGPFEQMKAKQKYRPVDQPFIIYPSAPIVHKNNLNAVSGFKLFNEKAGGRYKLVITSTFDKDTREEIQNICQDVVFTGNVSDEELNGYYESSELLMFASLAEGLGMPILEAVDKGKPVACSNIPVLTEISEDAFYLFDPLDPHDIAKALLLCSRREGWDRKKKMYDGILQKYRWERSAEILTDVLTKKMSIQAKVSKPNLLIISPSPNDTSPEAKFIEYTYASLSRVYKINCRIVASKNPKSPAYVPYILDEYANLDQDIILIIGKNNIKIGTPVNSKVIRVIFQKRSSSAKTLIPSMLQRLSRRKQERVVNIYASPKVIDSGLGVSYWEYYFPDRSRPAIASDLVRTIKQKAKEV